MAVKNIVMVFEKNTHDGIDYYEVNQGTEFEFVRVYKIENDDGTEQYFSFTIPIDSYGSLESLDSIPVQFVEVKPQEKSVTVFA